MDIGDEFGIFVLVYSLVRILVIILRFYTKLCVYLKFIYINIYVCESKNDFIISLIYIIKYGAKISFKLFVKHMNVKKNVFQIFYVFTYFG